MFPPESGSLFRPVPKLPTQQQVEADRKQYAERIRQEFERECELIDRAGLDKPEARAAKQFARRRYIGRAKDELRRRMENDEQIQAFANVMCRRRGITGLEKNPETEEWTIAALDIHVNQEEEIPLPTARHAFHPQSHWFKKLIDGCRNEETVEVDPKNWTGG